MVTRPMSSPSFATMLTASALNPAAIKDPDPPGPRSNSSKVLLHITSALDLSVRCGALSTIRTGIPYRANSEAAVMPTGPAPTIKTFAFIALLLLAAWARVLDFLLSSCGTTEDGGAATYCKQSSRECSIQSQCRSQYRSRW